MLSEKKKENQNPKINLPRFPSSTRLAIDLILSETEDPIFGNQNEMLPVSFCSLSKALEVSCKYGF